MPIYTPKVLYEAYRNGLSGCIWEEHVYDELIRTSKYAYFKDGSRRIKGSGKGKLSTPFKSVLKFDKQAYIERQTTGDCQNGSDLVTMADGSLKQIKDIKIGDYVISAFGEKRKVTNTFKKPYNKKMVELTLANHTKVASTPDHRYIVDNTTMNTRPIETLRIGDKVFAPLDENMIEILDIKIVEPEEQFVYCIEVEKDHNFICNGIGINNCVSHSTRNACDLTRAVEIDVKGEGESWIARGATEAIYGYRGHGGQGMSCARAATFVSQTGGVLVRKNYPDIADFSRYDGNMGARWGGRGLPDKVIDAANDHQVKTVSLIKTVEEAMDAIANGYGLSVCSNYGFSNRRDSKGFARKSGSWAHAMAWTACDDTGSEPAFLVQNSWGKWNSGGHPEWGPIPDGSFLIQADVAAGMLRQNGAYAFSDFNGFPPQKLPNYGFKEYL